MRKAEINGSGNPRHTPDSLDQQAELYTTEQVLEELSTLGRRRAEYLQRCHTDTNIPPEERKQALYDYCVVLMAEERLTRNDTYIHNPFSFPDWLALAQSQMAEFIMEDLTTREALADTQLFNEDSQVLHNFANSVSASIVPQEDYDDDKVFATGVLSEEIRSWVLPPIRADELTLA